MHAQMYVQAYNVVYVLTAGMSTNSSPQSRNDGKDFWTIFGLKVITLHSNFITHNHPFKLATCGKSAETSSGQHFNTATCASRVDNGLSQTNARNNKNNNIC